MSRVALYQGDLRNLNGEGRWSVEAVQKRYFDYCAALRVETSRSLAPSEHREGNVQWIYPHHE
jgi:hypothetical protein